MSDAADTLRKKAQELLDLADEIEGERLFLMFKALPAKDRKRFLAMIAAEGVSLPEAK